MLSIIIFIICMLLVYLRPFGLRVWISTLFCAALAWLFGATNLKDIIFIFNLVGDSALCLVGLILLANALEKIGFFDFLSEKIIRLSIFKKRISSMLFFIFLVILGSILSAFLANDGAILILSPLIFALFKNQQNIDSIESNIESKSLKSPQNTALFSFLLCVSFVSDFGSNFFIFSNLTNIITAKALNFSFFDFFLKMLAPQIAALLAFALSFWIFLGRKLPKKLRINPSKSRLNTTDCVVCFVLLFSLVFFVWAGKIAQMPICMPILCASFFALIFAKARFNISLKSITKAAPFGIVGFCLGLFVVVFSLKNVGALEILKLALNEISQFSQSAQIWAVGLFSSLLSCAINNLPANLLGDLALQNLLKLDSMQEPQTLALAHLLGCNIGSKFIPLGSLATLLWLSSLKARGFKISLKSFLLNSLLITTPTLFAALFALCVFA